MRRPLGGSTGKPDEVLGMRRWTTRVDAFASGEKDGGSDESQLPPLTLDGLLLRQQAVVDRI